MPVVAATPLPGQRAAACDIELFCSGVCVAVRRTAARRHAVGVCFVCPLVLMTWPSCHENASKQRGYMPVVCGCSHMVGSRVVRCDLTVCAIAWSAQCAACGN